MDSTLPIQEKPNFHQRFLWSLHKGLSATLFFRKSVTKNLNSKEIWSTFRRKFPGIFSNNEKNISFWLRCLLVLNFITNGSFLKVWPFSGRTNLQHLTPLLKLGNSLLTMLKSWDINHPQVNLKVKMKHSNRHLSNQPLSKDLQEANLNDLEYWDRGLLLTK